MKNFRFSLVFLTCSLMTNQVSAQNVDWPSYGGDNGSNKYSALNQINSDNVSQLVTAWEWDSPDNALVADIAV